MTSLAVQKKWEIVDTIASDGSSRRYTRVRKEGQTLILMECDGSTPSHRISDYVRIAKWMKNAGLKVPEIYEGSEGEGYLLIEDFGGISFKEAMKKKSPAELYPIAADVLKVMAEAKLTLDLPEYFSSHIHEGHRRVIDWYVPTLLKKKNPDDLANKYFSAWQEIEKNLPKPNKGFVHADFHIENLLWLDHEKGINRCGIIDFQGAMDGPLAYDLGNLLEDARANVAPDIQEKILKNYDQDFLSWYRVLTTQFHCRVIGQFIKMAIKDEKTQYLIHIPRLESYIKNALKDPLLKPLAQFFKETGISIGEEKIDLAQARSFICHDAF